MFSTLSSYKNYQQVTVLPARTSAGWTAVKTEKKIKTLVQIKNGKALQQTAVSTVLLAHYLLESVVLIKASKACCRALSCKNILIKDSD